MAWSKESRQARGYGAAWDRLRLRILKRDHYLCQPCLRVNRVTHATEVDHIKPKAKGGTNDAPNLQAICAPCHEAKTIIDQGGTPRPKQTIGVDGYPVGG
jgi:5-methylcytosine-specific restriction enzyme A